MACLSQQGHASNVARGLQGKILKVSNMCATQAIYCPTHTVLGP